MKLWVNIVSDCLTKIYRQSQILISCLCYLNTCSLCDTTSLRAASSLEARAGGVTQSPPTPREARYDPSVIEYPMGSRVAYFTPARVAVGTEPAYPTIETSYSIGGTTNPVGCSPTEPPTARGTPMGAVARNDEVFRVGIGTSSPPATRKATLLAG